MFNCVPFLCRGTNRARALRGAILLAPMHTTCAPPRPVGRPPSRLRHNALRPPAGASAPPLVPLTRYESAGRLAARTPRLATATPSGGAAGLRLASGLSGPGLAVATVGPGTWSPGRYHSHSTWRTKDRHSPSRPGSTQSLRHPGPGAERLLGVAAWVDFVRSDAVLDTVVRDVRLYLDPKTPLDGTALLRFGLKDQVLPGRYRLEVDRDGAGFTLFSAQGGVVQH